MPGIHKGAPRPSNAGAASKGPATRRPTGRRSPRARRLAGALLRVRDAQGVKALIGEQLLGWEVVGGRLGGRVALVRFS